MAVQHAFTVDVEDYFQVSAFDSVLTRQQWPTLPARVVESTHRILDLLARHSVTATFYILGWVADRHPHLVREIASAGHELGSHSYWHHLVYRMSADEFRRDVALSRNLLEDLSGQRVVSFRAPSFSITRRSLWALEILAEEGLETDSSIFPVYHDRYGIPDAPVGIHHYATPAGGIWEFPPTVRELGRWRLPWAGGGYFRLLPERLFRRGLAAIERTGRPCVFYIHPWELDADQPRMAGISRLTSLRHYLNLRHTEARLERLLKQFSFGSVAQVVARHQQQGLAAPALHASPLA